AGHGAAEVRMCEHAGEGGCRHAVGEPLTSGPLADHEDLVRHAAPPQLAQGVGEDVETLFHHEPAEEADRDLVVGYAERAAPSEIAAGRIEDLAIDPARPDADVVAHALRAEHVDHALRRRNERVAAMVEPP